MSVHLSLVLPWMIVLSLQSVRPCVFVSIVSAPPGTLQGINGRGHQVGFTLQFYSASSGMQSLLKYTLAVSPPPPFLHDTGKCPISG